jgi:hypothetical protein
MSDPPAPPAFKMPRLTVTPPRHRRPPAMPTGPRIFRQTRRGTVSYGGPGKPPEGFIRATNSGDEWHFYWACFKALRPDLDPRKPPYFGIPEVFDYQSPQLGGFTRALGSAVVDFLFWLSNPPLVVRLTTYYFHHAADAAQQAHDRIQAVQLAGRFDVIDVPSQAFIGDPSGQTAVRLVKETLGLVRRQDPLTAGTVRLVRPAI